MFKLSPFTYTFSSRGKSKKIFLDSTITFKPNDTVAIIGPSGGGKSTLLKILKGIIPEFSGGTIHGEILFNGKPLNGKYFQENLQKILYLFQNPFSQLIYPQTEEEFLFSMENSNFSREEMDFQKEKFENLFNLKNIWGKKTTELSNGECQKLVLASLLAIGPEVLLLDEPTAFLDPEARTDFYHHLNFLRKDRLLIIVDHHVDEIRPFINKVVKVDYDGRITEATLDAPRILVEKIQLPILFDFNDLELNVSDVKFWFQSERKLLDSVEATFKGGEITVIKGRNGQGKSTLFNLISGVLSPISGTITLRRDGATLKNEKIFSQVGFVFQNPEAHFFFDTIEEELKQTFRFLGKERKELMNHLVERFFYDIDLKKSPFLLSEGEKRRLSILMTVFLEKSLILYDEPTFGQDRKSIEEIISLVTELKKLGIIQLVISHDQYFIERVADHVMQLEAGRLVEIHRT